MFFFAMRRVIKTGKGTSVNTQGSVTTNIGSFRSRYITGILDSGVFYENISELVLHSKFHNAVFRLVCLFFCLLFSCRQASVHHYECLKLQ